MATQQTATLGGGCFWCLDAAYRRIRGIISSTCGYAGGTARDPSYEQVSTGTTGHAEVVQLVFDGDIISLSTILDIFWAIHDPTTKDRQGNDAGAQYRSIIFYNDDTQQQTATTSLANAQALWPSPIVTQVVPLDVFYPAESYHQNYFNNHPELAYCQVVINPKLHKLQQKFAQLILPHPQ